MAFRTHAGRIAAVAALAGAASLGVVSTSGPAFAASQPATATHSATAARVAQAADSFKFYGPYGTYEQCAAAQKAFVIDGGTVLWTCGYTHLEPTPEWMFAGAA